MLLCEYLPGGNLRDWLYGGTSQSSWYVLAASAPDYLHTQADMQCVLKATLRAAGCILRPPASKRLQPYWQHCRDAWPSLLLLCMKVYIDS